MCGTATACVWKTIMLLCESVQGMVRNNASAMDTKPCWALTSFLAVPCTGTDLSR